MIRPNRDTGKRTGTFVAAVMLLFAAAGIVWWLYPRPVSLDQDRYEITIALYRICNQRDKTGLAEIEGSLDAALSTNGSSDNDSVADAAIRSIIESGRSGDWRRAVRDCRKLLDAQTRAVGRPNPAGPR